MNLILLLVGFAFLISGGDLLLKSAVSISLRLRIPKIIIGMTVVSFATSAPELIVSVKSALEGFPDLAVGNIIGSNIANLGLVLGITLLVTRMDVQKSFFTTDWLVMMIASFLFYVFIVNDLMISFLEGVILFSSLILFIIYLLVYQKDALIDEGSDEGLILSNSKNLMFLILGIVGLWVGSELLIKGAVDVAKDFGVSERIIGISVVSVGTSIPELATSLIAVMKKEKAISLGNLIGSNIFNILAVIGLTSIITPIKIVEQALSSRDIYWMLAISFSLLLLAFLPKKMQLDKKSGAFLLALYIVFIYQTFS